MSDTSAKSEKRNLSRLEERIRFLEKNERWFVFALDFAASLVSIHGAPGKSRDPGWVLAETQRYLKRLSGFSVTAFYLVDERDSSFYLECCEPANEAVRMEQVVVGLIESGEFAWALNQNRTVGVKTQKEMNPVLLHVLATQTRVRGMFVGIPEDSALEPSSSFLNLLSIILHNTAYALESAALYALLTEQNQSLEERIEEALAQVTAQNLELHRQVEELTRMREALHDAKETAEAANRVKGDFLAAMSHEIRTPLNGILGMTELLQNTELTSRQKHFVRTVRNSGDGLLSIINDILDFSKIEAGRLELEREEIDLPLFLEDLVTPLAEQSRTKGLSFFFLFRKEAPRRLLGDPVRLRQVLLNLLSNAVKFTHTGQIALTVTMKGERVLFQVEDTGIGIPADAIAGLFDPFTQVDPSTTRKFGGTGLGLAIVRRLVDLMEGQVFVESQTGQGSRFSIAVPLGERVAEEETERVLPGQRVLVVDLHPLGRRVMAEVVARLGGDCVEADSASQALFLLREASSRKRPFQFLFLDNNLPDMDGLTFASSIRGDAKTTVHHVFLMAGMGQTVPETQWQESGIQGVLYKPLFFTVLDHVLRGRWREGGLGPGLEVDASLLAGIPSSARILLVEDDPTNRDVLLGLLQRMGIVPDVAVNGLEAVEQVKARPFDLVLMDCQMPEMDGFTATRAIRDLESATGKRCVIVALTAYALKGDRERCLASGMDDYLPKPINGETLRQAIHRWLAVAPQTREVAHFTAFSEKEEPPVTSASEEPINRQKLEQLRKDLGGEITWLVERFVRNIPARIKAISEAIAAGDAMRLAGEAHRFKGAIGFLGADHLAALCRQMEEEGRNGRFDAAKEQLSALILESDRVKNALIPEL